MIRRRQRRGFTLIEVMIAAALLGFSLVVMFGLQGQAVRSNLQARRITDCTYLAQQRMERLMALRWNNTARPLALTDLMGEDPTAEGTNVAVWSFLEHPASGAQPVAINASGNTDTNLGPTQYFVTWDIEDMDTQPPWVRIRVRCQFFEDGFNRWQGTTISSYRFQ